MGFKPTKAKIAFKYLIWIVEGHGALLYFLIREHLTNALFLRYKGQTEVAILPAASALTNQKSAFCNTEADCIRTAA